MTPKFPQVIDSTIRGQFASCPRQFFYSTILGLGPRRLSIHLHFGACFATGLEVYRREFYPIQPGAIDALGPLHDQALYLGFLAIIRAWDEYPAEDEEPKTLWRCLGALDYYFEVHPPAIDIVQPYIKQDKTPAVEYSFTLPMDLHHPETNEPLIYAGRFDMLGVYEDQLVVVDEKTTKQLGPSWSSSWDLRAQFKGYMYAARQFGHKTMGSMVRGVALRTSGFDHGEAFIQCNEWELDRWWTQLHKDTERMIRAWEEEYWDYNLDSACTAYGGCGFTSLCKVPEGNIGPWVEAEYIERRWNPLAKDPLRDSRLKENPLLAEVLREEEG